MKKLLSIALALLMLVALTACNSVKSAGSVSSASGATGATADEKPVKLAVVGPMTGDYAEYGIAFKAACEIAVDEWNAKGGVLGRPIELVSYDDKNIGEEAASVAEKIVSDKDIVAVVGHFASGVAMAAAPIYEEAGIPLLSASAGHPDFSGMGEYMFRNNAPISLDMGHAVQIIHSLGKTKVGVLMLKNDWGVSAYAAFEEAMNQIEPYSDMRIVQTEEFMDGTVDYSPNITKFVGAGCDAIMILGMYNVIGPFAKQYKEVDPDIALVTNSAAFSIELLNLGGEAVEGLMFATNFYYGSQKPVVRSFVDEYIARTEVPPSNLTAQAYDNADIVFAAIEAGGSANPADIKDQLYKISIEGTTGEIYFDENGDAVKTQTLIKIEDGAFVEVLDAFVPQQDFVDSMK